MSIVKRVGYYMQYGAAVLVTSGILITGTLWYDREDKLLRGEDIAEIAGATWERSVVPYLWGTNEIPYMSYSQTVTTVTSRFCNVTIEHIDGSLGPCLGFSTEGATNILFLEKDVGISVPMYTFHNFAGYATGEPPATATYRLSCAGQSAIEVALSVPWPPYSYANGPVDMTWCSTYVSYSFNANGIYWGNAFTLTLAPSNWVEYTVEAQTNVVYFGGDEYKLSPFLNGTFGIYWFANKLRETALITSQNSIYWVDPNTSLGNGTVLWQADDDYVLAYTETNKNGQVVEKWDYIVTNGWDMLPVTQTYTIPAFGTGLISTAFYPAPTLVTNNNYPLGAIFSTSTNPVNEGKSAAESYGSFWESRGLNPTNAFMFSYEYITNDLITTGYFLNRDVMDEIKKCSDGLTRTMAVISPGAMQWERHKYTEIYTPDDEGGMATNGEAVSSSFPTFFGDATSYASGGGTTETTNYYNGFGCANDYCSYYAYSGGYTYGSKDYDEEWHYYWTSGWDADRISHSSSYYGCTLPYPSLYAVTSGYVNAIHIYAVSALEEIGLDSPTTPATNHLDEYTETIPSPSEYDNFTLGRCEYVAGYPAFQSTASSSGGKYPLIPASPTPRQIKLNLVETISNPDKDWSFDFVNTVDWVTPPLQEMYVQHADYDASDPDHKKDWIVTRHTKWGNVEVAVVYFVVVVDWDFKHLGTVGFNPTENIPEWHNLGE